MVKRSNEELAEWISEYYLGRDCSCEQETKCQVCSLGTEIKNQLDKKDESYAILEAENASLKATNSACCDNVGKESWRIQRIKELEAELERVKLDRDGANVSNKFLYDQEQAYRQKCMGLEARLAEACNVIQAVRRSQWPEGEAFGEKAFLVPVSDFSMLKNFRATHSPTPPLQKGCEHDKGTYWVNQKPSTWFYDKSEFPECPTCKLKEPDTLGKCGSWISFNGEEYACQWPKDHMGCHSAYAKGKKIKWKALDAGGAV